MSRRWSFEPGKEIPLDFIQLWIIDSLWKELFRDDLKEEGVVVGPGHWIRSNLKWRKWVTEDETWSTFQGHSAGRHGGQGLAFPRNKTDLDESLWVFPDDGIEWCGNREAKEAVNLFCLEMRERWKERERGERARTGLVQERISSGRREWSCLQVSPDKKSEGGIRAPFPAPAFGVVWVSIISFHPLSLLTTHAHLAMPSFQLEEGMAQISALPGKHLWLVSLTGLEALSLYCKHCTRPNDKWFSVCLPLYLDQVCFETVFSACLALIPVPGTQWVLNNWNLLVIVFFTINVGEWGQDMESLK